MMLLCSNEDCASRVGDETRYFNINVTVDEDRDVAESLRKVEAQYFTCVYCNSDAEDVGEEEEEEEYDLDTCGCSDPGCPCTGPKRGGPP